MLRGCSGDDDTYLPSAVFEEEYKRTRPYGTGMDVVSVRDLLTSAACESGDMTLDEASNHDGAVAGETWRSSGLLISIPIRYLNKLGVTDTGSEIRYRYIPAQVSGTEYKVIETQNNPNGSITYLNRHGIRIVFEQTGELGHFDFMQLLTGLVTALALLKVSTTIVELLMLSVLPQKLLYQKAKFEDTEDFSDIRDKMASQKKKRVGPKEESGPTSPVPTV
ncbi:cytochrome c oxidase subunit 1 [Borealophlyctis nickersoniae]|nr:cytochrome c oxidase subunit 1 [Borealophlyctis nickersoniae]